MPHFDTLHRHDTAAAPPFRAEPGFELGWDYAHYGCVPPAEHLHPLSTVRQGWEAGRECFGRRMLQADRFVRKWLTLRLNAWLRGRAFEDTQVNPAFLRRIDVTVCPITRELLTHGTGGPSDASVDRVFNDAGYAAGNLAVMSTRANRAKGAHGVDEAMAFATQAEAAPPRVVAGLKATQPGEIAGMTAAQAGEIAGLTAAQWARVAVLMSFVTPMAHARVAAMPLLVLPPNRLRVLNPVQSLQVLLSLQFTAGGHARRCAALAALMPSAEARYAFNAFMHTLLARRLAVGRLTDARAERHAVEDLWRDPLVYRRWQRLSHGLTAADCDRIGRAAADRGLAGRGVRWLTDDAATEGWALATRGYLGADHAGTARPLPSPAPLPTAAAPAFAERRRSAPDLADRRAGECTSPRLQTSSASAPPSP